MHISTQIPRGSHSLIMRCRQLPVTILLDKVTNAGNLTTPRLVQRYLSASLAKLKAKGKIPQSCYCRISGNSVIISNRSKKEVLQRGVLQRDHFGSHGQAATPRKSHRVRTEYIQTLGTLKSLDDLLNLHNLENPTKQREPDSGAKPREHGTPDTL